MQTTARASYYTLAHNRAVGLLLARKIRGSEWEEKEIKRTDKVEQEKKAQSDPTSSVHPGTNLQLQPTRSYTHSAALDENWSDQHGASPTPAHGSVPPTAVALQRIAAPRLHRWALSEFSGRRPPLAACFRQPQGSGHGALGPLSGCARA
ncbi:hypothetical protein TgHK011_006157 [Trichoderma gracile]|nr:hypothetical protein TgHK011_006157 [Trichoderma gracile]